MIIQEIYYILIIKLCLTDFILKASKIRNIQTKQNSQRQVTRMHEVSTQSEENLKTDQHTCLMCRHIQKKH